MIPLRLIALVLPGEKSGLTGVHVLEVGAQRSVIEIYTAPLPKGTAAARAVDEQRLTILEEGATALRRFPELAAVLRGEPIRSLFAFPVSTSHRRIGAPVAASESHSLSGEDVELLGGVASQLCGAR